SQEVGSAPQLVESQLDIAVADDSQCRARVAARNDIEPVERPVEMLGPGPPEAAARCRLVRTMVEQKVECVAKLCRRIHLCSAATCANSAAQSLSFANPGSTKASIAATGGNSTPNASAPPA